MSISQSNNSGEGPGALLPPELGGWNWGGFLLTWVWGIGNNVWISLVALAPVPGVGLAIGILLGLKGNEWAWQNKRWESLEHFRKVQRTWLYWGIAALMAPFVLLLGLLLIAIGILGYFGYIKF